MVLIHFKRENNCCVKKLSMPVAVLPNQGLINFAMQFIDFLPGVIFQEVLLRLAASCICPNLISFNADCSFTFYDIVDGLRVVPPELQA